jgi:hypothetical protein
MRAVICGLACVLLKAMVETHAVAGDAAGVAATGPSAVPAPALRGFDRSSGTLVLETPAELLTSDPGDVIRVVQGRTSSARRAPWFNSGHRTAREATRALVERAHAHGIEPSVVLVSYRSVPRWHYTAADTAVLDRHPWSAQLKATLGLARFPKSGLSVTQTAVADRVLRANFQSALSASIGTAIHARWPGVPVIAVENRDRSSIQALLAKARTGVPGVMLLDDTSGRSAEAAVRSIAVRKLPEATAVLTAAGPVPQNGTSAVTNPLTLVGSNGEWTARFADGRVLFESWRPDASSADTVSPDKVRPSIALSQTPHGVRIELTYRNEGNQARVAAGVVLPSLRLGNAIGIRDMKEVGANIELSPGSAWQGTYPGSLYCPAIVAGTASGSIGVSVSYPLLEYRHEVRLELRDATNGSWVPVIAFTNSPTTSYESRIEYPAVLGPGTVRTYRIDITAAGTANWVEALAPYREHLRATYGAVRYRRDGRAVAGVSLAMGELQTAANPKGWVPEAGDPENDGFLNASQHIARQLQRADRIMVWTPSGLAPEGPTFYPYQFASPLTAMALPATDGARPLSASDRLRMLASGGKEVGLWWGRAGMVERGWNGHATSEPLDPMNPEHRAFAWRELDAAAECGAKTIGLDAFAHSLSPTWNLVKFLELALERHPSLKFVTEGRGCDVLHLFAPTWCDGYRYVPSPTRSERIPTCRFEVADYLVPGHETWVGMQFDRSRNSLLWGPNESINAQVTEIRAVQALGYVPVCWLPVDMRPFNSP